MPLTKNARKRISFFLFITVWTAAIFWVGWQSPTLIGGPFLTQEPEIKLAKFYPLDKFVISIPGDEYPHYLLLEMAFKSRSNNAANTIKKADPVIKNSLMKMFSKKHFNELNNAQQLESLQKEAHILLSLVLAENDFAIELDDVLFTRMVIQ
ncbi:flagellar basal body protein FliL [Shewanella sp. Choline-02u-19]|jgi:flagellar FliL protein|uniref:flagellar basal body-associated FliL family protein n=1 Tax=unclassified Shewanella TaxID=196818 RepID=UPI000C33DC2B|nr:MULTISPECIES: flagellar basal body-associated FliL family protein [unclassified Shewanella]PKG56109.1 flagellar basal body protein FliL [Shewanella sp. GutDb-MelDb]PKH57281.1 flagellar basal body protein FliL [Shewanella sp. Bg11-22]PKI29605.1 flagellar basal body protein FliL [Shewanella sp. Choline-02u-19]